MAEPIEIRTERVIVTGNNYTDLRADIPMVSK